MKKKEFSVRKFGLDTVGGIPWGTHLCQFYETTDDLVEILIPYFAEGLRNNEFCMWITSPPLEASRARQELGKAVPELDEYFKKGQIEIIPYENWYLVDNRFDSDRVLEAWIEKEKSAVSHGFDGLRLSGNTFWIEKRLWRDFTEYEAAVNDKILSRRMIALCTYCLGKCSGNDVIDVVRNHVGTLVKKGKEWVMVEDAVQRKATEALYRNVITKRKGAEENLRRLNERFEMAQHAAGVGVWEWDVETGKIEWTPEMFRLFGLDPRKEKASLETWTAIIHPEDRETATSKMNRALNTRSFLDNEYRIVRPDGKIVWISALGQGEYDEQNQPIRMSGICTDITERKKAEHEKRESEKAHAAAFYARNLIEASLDPLVTISANGKITDVNEATEKVTGYSRKQLIGSDFSNYFTQPEMARKGYEEVFTKGFVKDYPLAIRHKSGEITNVLYNATVFKREDGKISGVFAAARDITEHLRNEEILRKQAALIDLSPDGIIIKKPDGTITFWSLGAEKLYGWTKAQAIGKKIDTLLKTSSQEPIEKINSQLRKEGKWSGELTHQTSFGRTVAVQSYWLAKFDEHGQIDEVFESNLDVTQRKDAQRLAVIGQTAGMVGHDIRNPLQAIIGDVYLAKMSLGACSGGEEKENLRESLDAIQNQTEYINKIIMDLQDFAKPLNPVSEETELEPIIKELLAKDTLPENIQTESQVSNDARKIMADSAYIKRILGNLITNAAQAMPEGGKLSLRAYRDANDTIITVRDTGEGIPEEAKSKLFQPLFTTKSKGQGFGLAVVKRLTEALNGTVTFESEEGKGTKFELRFSRKNPAVA